jgi:hypothetical protein
VGAGVVTNTGAAATLAIDAETFSGTISGALSVEFDGSATLSGLEDYTGNATVVGSSTVANGGTYDLVADSNVSATSGDGHADTLWQNADGQASI